MPNLVALFEFEELDPKSELEQYGEGSIQISCDREPETQDDFNDIARAIFQRGNYKQVVLKKVFYDDKGLFDALTKPGPDNEYNIDASGEAGILDDVIPGEIVKDDD